MRLIVLTLLLPLFLIASPKEADQWRSWVEKQKQPLETPRLYNNYATSVTQWFSPLSLKADKNGATFSFTVTIFGEKQWVYLPGDGTWPTTLKNSQGKLLPILKHTNKPAVLLSKGTHKLTGTFRWAKIPAEISLPKSYSLLNISLLGTSIIHPIQRNGQLVLTGSDNLASQQVQRNTMELKLFRQLADGIPQIITSRLELVITGDTRDETLGQLLPNGTELITLESELPAIISPEGILRTQLKPGKFAIILKSRTTTVQNEFITTTGPEDWPLQEIWSFKKDDAQRVVALDGVSQVDPSQTDVPEEWRALPTFLLEKNDTLKLTEKSRGDQNPSPDKLSLSRSFRLDFNGKGFTIEDKLKGSITRPTELTMLTPAALGNAVMNRLPHLVIESQEGTGVGVPAGHLALLTTSRIEKRNTSLPATGWKKDLESLNATLHLPPGWDLLHVNGPDQVNGSILSRWSLWDLFLLLIIIVLIYKNFGLVWTLASSLGLIILFHASGAPKLLWLNLLIAVTILKQLPANQWREAFRGYAVFVLFIGIIMVIPLSIKTLREVVYPQLKDSSLFASHALYDMAEMTKSDNDFFDEELEEGGWGGGSGGLQQEPTLGAGGVSKRVSRSSYSSNRVMRKKMKQYQPDENLQTGPGKPTWTWSQYSLSWSGPVSQSQSVRFFLVAPIVTRIGNTLAILGLIALVIKFILAIKAVPMVKIVPKKTTKKKKDLPKPPPLLALLLLLSLVIPVRVKAEYPPQHLMEKIEKQVDSLLAVVPPCFPQCAEISKADLSVTGSSLSLTLSISAEELVAFPLLIQHPSLTITSITINGVAGSAVRAGQLNVLLQPGVNRVEIKGKIPGNQAHVKFATAVHNLQAKTPKWNIIGLENGAIAGNTLQLSKQVKEQTKGTSIGEQAPAAPFVVISRHFTFGREQLIETTIKRVAPELVPLTVKVPLLDKEAILTNDVRIKENKAIISLPADQESISFASKLQDVTFLKLSTNNNSSQVEEWTISSDPRYRITTTGLLPIKEQGVSELLRWKPRSGDSLIIAIEKPDAVLGKTTTIERINLLSQAGKVTSSNTLSLSVNSSKGDPLTINLPPNSAIEMVTIGAIEQILSDSKEKLSIPLHPGKQEVKVVWKQDNPISLKAKTPKLTLSAESANITLNYQMPRSRWVIALGGPIMGPAMLIWGILVFFITLAIALPRFMETPLTRLHWLLLFLGVSSVHYLGAIPLILWFAAMVFRKKYPSPEQALRYNILQLLLVGVIAFALLSLAISIPMGLLNNPDMHITGNGSSAYSYTWYQDRASTELPQGWVISLPIEVYKGIMLAWSIWIALKLPIWLKWSWETLSAGTFWKKRKDALE